MLGTLVFFSLVAQANDPSLPVKVFILAGQSNMAGQGVVTPSQGQIDKNNGKGTLRYLVKNSPDKNDYKHLISGGNWTVRNDVWLADLNTSGALTVRTNKIGPELQFGHLVGDALENPVLLIKTAWGGKSLYNDFRPPSSGGKTGNYYYLMIDRIHEVLNNIGSYVPNYQGQGYELAGIAWHQGWNDRVNQTANDEYQENCVNLINDLRAEFNTPNLPFAIATTGMSGWNENHPRALSLMEAQLAVPNDSRLLNSTNVVAIDTRDFYREQSDSPTAQGYHWNSNAESYYLIGDALARNLVSMGCQQASCVTNILQAEDNTHLHDANVTTSVPGYTGTGFVDYFGAGSYVEWPSVNIDNDGEYTLTFRYAVERGQRRSRLLINGSAIADIPFNKTGSWENWETVSINVNLTRGQHLIKVEAYQAGPNLDYMKVEPYSVANRGVQYEAEENTTLSKSSVTNVHAGYTGTGFIDFGGAGSSVEWPSINIPNDGNYKIKFRYAVERGSRNSRLFLNGSPIADLSFSATGSWTNWKTETYEVFLPKGIHKLKVQAIQAGPNLDHMAIGSENLPPDVYIEKVYFGQNHILEPNDNLFELVSDLDALLKVQVLADEANANSPEVSAMLYLNGQSTKLTMQGPATVPTEFNSERGAVQHKSDDSFTTTIPKEWVKPGLRITIAAGNNILSLDNLTITSPNKVVMNMFDVHYFNQTTGDYPSGWLSELESKWPVSSLELRRVNNIVFEELVIPPRSGVRAAKVRSRQDYKDQTGLNFDGEQGAALQWVGALQAAAGSRHLSLYYVNIYGVHSGGQAGGFKGVGNGKSQGILHHELGHALSLPHWGGNAQYPYKGHMYGIEARDANATHAGPTWAYDLRNGNFIPPTIQDNAVGGKIGTYKADPMQGGGQGDQEQGYVFRHFSDYSVNKIRNYLEGHLVKWNDRINRYAKWNAQSGDYTNTVSSNGVNFPIIRDVNVYSVMVAASGSTPNITMIYPPIGPYKTGLIKLFDPRSRSDREEAKSIFCPAKGCDLTAKIRQGNQDKYFMLPIAWDPNENPLSGGSLHTRAINLPASEGTIDQVTLYLTPNADSNGMGSNPTVITQWQ